MRLSHRNLRVGIYPNWVSNLNPVWISRLGFENGLTDEAGRTFTRRNLATNPITTTDPKVGSNCMSSTYASGGIYLADNEFVINTGPFTFDFWARFTNYSTGACLIDYRIIDTTLSAMLIQQEGTSLTFYRNYVSGTPFLSLTGFFNVTNTWMRITIVRNNDTLMVFRNGVNVSTTAITGFTFSTSNRLTFAARFANHATGDYGVNGAVDDFKFARTANFLSGFDPAFDIA